MLALRKEDLKMKYKGYIVPTTEPHENEMYVPNLDIYFTTPNQYGVSWLRFGESSDIPSIIREQPHLAFDVDSIDEAIEGKEVLVGPVEPKDMGVRTAVIVEDGVLIEFVEDIKD
jgi:hypothetical protein